MKASAFSHYRCSNNLITTLNISTTTATSSTSQTTTESSQVFKRPKLLALHGGGGSATSLRDQLGMQDLMASLPQFDFVFAIAPEEGGVWLRDSPGGKDHGDESNNDGGDTEDGLWGDKEDGDWLNWNGDKEKKKGREKTKKQNKQAKKGATTDEGWADLSISYIDQMVASQGPFYGLLGYSQGSAFIPIYLANTQNTFNRVMLYCGYLPITHEGLMATLDRVTPIAIPAMIFSGENDSNFAPMAPAQADRFENALRIHSSVAGHELPSRSDGTFNAIVDFIKAGMN